MLEVIRDEGVFVEVDVIVDMFIVKDDVSVDIVSVSEVVFVMERVVDIV